MTGDTMISARTVYRVTSSREIESRVWCNRWKVTLDRVGTRAEAYPRGPHVDDDGHRVVRFVQSYRKGETPAEFFARHATT